jgi:hypothetical protein
MQRQPAALDRQVAFLAEQERPVYQLDVNPAVLHDLDAIGDLDDLAGCSGPDQGAGQRRTSCSCLNGTVAVTRITSNNKIQLFAKEFVGQ